MKTTKTNAMTSLMSEYVMWGGPVVARSEALADMQMRGFDAKAIDVCVFGRKAVDAPSDPAAHVAFLRRIQEMDGITMEMAA